MRFGLCSAVLVGICAFSWLGGCGAKTGLSAPDFGPMDVLDGATADMGRPRICVEVPPDDTPVVASLTTPVSVRTVDVMFVIDASASMDDEIDAVRSRLRRVVVPGIREFAPDAQFGVALVGEFPIRPHGLPSNEPYQLRSQITDDVILVEGALEDTPSWGNYDVPEAQMEGLYQIVTGAGLDPYIAPSVGCSRGGFGGACFRTDAISIAMLITDAPFHNGPPGVPPVDNYEFTPAPQSYEAVVAELRRTEVRVVGLGARDTGTESPMPHLRAIARDSGATMADGTPFAFDIGDAGAGIGGAVVDAVAQLASGLPLDLRGEVVDGMGDLVDATDFVVAVRPRSLTPSDAGRIVADGFEDVRPGSSVTFEIEFDTSSLRPVMTTLRIPATLIVRAFGRSIVGEVAIEIVVPGEDGDGC